MVIMEKLPTFGFFMNRLVTFLRCTLMDNIATNLGIIHQMRKIGNP